MGLLYRYAGPDGEGIAGLPPGSGAAIGSEYCVHLLPGVKTLGALLDRAREGNVPLLLLTPYFRDAEMKRAIPLLRSIPEGADVTVAINDWGMLLAAHALFPRLRLTIGRLLSGQKRCPRIQGSPFLTERGRAWHGEGIFASRRAREYLAGAFGVRGYHADPLEWSRLLREGAGAEAEKEGTAPEAQEFTLFLHAPFAIVTVSDGCPWIGGASSATVPSCSRPCRGGAVVLREPSMGELFQKGKGRFVRTSADPTGVSRNPHRPAWVLYDDLP